MATTRTPKEIALEWGTDARTLRKFLRSENGTGRVGQGNRHAIPANRLKSLRKGFDAWNTAKNEKAVESTEAPATADSDEAPESE